MGFNQWFDYGVRVVSSNFLLQDLILIRLLQLTLLLGLSLVCCWLMTGQRAAARHGLLFCSILGATLLTSTALLGLKPDVVINIPSLHMETSKTDSIETMAAADLKSVAPKSTFQSESLTNPLLAKTDSIVPAEVTVAGTLPRNPGQDLSIPQSSARLESPTNEDVHKGQESSMWLPTVSYVVLAIAIWFTGVLAIVFGSIFQHRRMAAFLQSSLLVEPSGLSSSLQSLLIQNNRKVTFRESRELSMPLAAGAIWPVILLPRDFRQWTQAQLRSVVAHEMAHVRRLDPLTSLVAFACCSILWFHPLMWIAYARMRRESERAADDLAISQGISPLDYAEHLISMVKRYGYETSFSPGTATMAASSQLRTRIVAVLNRKPQPITGCRQRIVALAMVFLLPLMAASVRFERVAVAQTVDANFVVSPLATVPKIQTHSEKQKKRWEELLKEVMNSTKEVRDQVQSDLNIAWKADKIEAHTMTLHYWNRSMVHLGESKESEKIREQALRSGSTELVRLMGANFVFALEAERARGDLDLALAPVKAKNFHNGSHHHFISETIRQGDLGTAERFIAELASSDRTHASRAAYIPSSLMLLNAELAIAAWKLGEHQRIEPALQRYRAELENSRPASAPRLAENMEWRQWDSNFELYLVNVLASSGKGTQAETLWNDPKLQLMFKDRDGKGRKRAAMHLSSRLAIAGENDIAIRIASQLFGNEIPAELYYWLCVSAARVNNPQLLEEYSANFLRKVEALCLFEEESIWQKAHTLPERATTYVSLGRAGAQLHRFIEAMSHPGSKQFATRGAELYMKMADRFVQEFEKQTIADLRIVREMREYSYQLDAIVKALPLSQVVAFSNRQDTFIAENSELLENPRIKGQRAGLLEERILALAKIAVPPRVEQVAKWSFQMKRELIVRLLEAGDDASARRFFEDLFAEAIKASSLSFNSGSLGGRTVDHATQTRYATAQMAVRFGQWNKGIEIIETIKGDGERVDGYRCMGIEYGKSGDLKKALEWAKTLEDDSYRLAACVGIVQSQAERIMSKQPSELDRFFDELYWLGVPRINWVIEC